MVGKSVQRVASLSRVRECNVTTFVKCPSGALSISHHSSGRGEKLTNSFGFTSFIRSLSTIHSSPSKQSCSSCDDLSKAELDAAAPLSTHRQYSATSSVCSKKRF